MSAGSLTRDVLDRLSRDPDSPAVAHWSGTWQDVSVREFHQLVTGVAKGLCAAGINAGDRVALLSRTRYEWTVVDYAAWWVGAVTVPLYDSWSPEQTAWALDDSGARLVVVESSRTDTNLSIPTWAIEPAGLRALTELGSAITDTELEKRRAQVGAADAATIIYTSGSTGTPKGCILTHGNLDAALDAALAALPELFEAKNASTLLFLPLAHVFARIVQIGAIRSGTRLGLSSDIAHLPDHLESFHPSFILTVPRMLERMFNASSQQAYADNRGGFFDRAARTAIAYSRSLETDGPGVALRARHAVFERSVYVKIRSKFGEQLQWIVTGGAPLGDQLAHFYRGIGVPVLEGYGLTETAAAVTTNTPAGHRIGTVGRAMSGTELQVDDDGTLLVRGPQVFASYWHDAESTTAALNSDGWFNTGDLAEIDGDGFVHILGRRDEVLITAAGKLIWPTTLEERIRSHPIVSQCLVTGDGKPYLIALVTIDRSAWSGKLTDPELRKTVQAAVDEANRTVSAAESVRKFEILDQDWTTQNGYLTGSHKLNRHAILSDFHNAVEALFVR